MRAKILIASATKNLRIAHALQKALATEFRVTVWDQGVFGPSDYVVPTFLRRTRESDFAIAVCGPDETKGKGDGTFAFVPSSNVLLELGIFIGVIGIQRSYLALASPHSMKIELPSDLSGFLWTQYDSSRVDENIDAAVGTAAHDIREAIALRFPAEKRQHAIADVRTFEGFHEDFARLISNCTKLEVCFVHSRRWRENHADVLERRLPSGEIVHVAFYFPDFRNEAFLGELVKRFSDGPAIPVLIYDSIKWALDLTKGRLAQTHFYLYSRLPSYSFYRFDNEAVLALYANATVKKQVPAILAREGSDEWQFVTKDISDFQDECAPITHDELLSEIESFGNRLALAGTLALYRKP